MKLFTRRRLWFTANDGLTIGGEPFGGGDDDMFADLEAGANGGNGLPAGDDDQGQQQNGGDGQQKKPDPWETMRSMQDALKSQGAILGTLAKKLTDAPAPQPQQQQQQQPTDTDAQLLKTKAELGDLMIRDPGEFALRMMQAAQAAGNASTAPVRQQQGFAMLENFKRDHADDPAFKLARPEFDALIEQEIATGTFVSMTPQQIQKGLDAIADMAIGRVARKGSASRQRQVPNYGAGGGGGGGGFSSQRGSGRQGDMGVDLNAPRDNVEREIVESMRGYGMADDLIKETIKAKRDDE